jgi:hypothetical protein
MEATTIYFYIFQHAIILSTFLICNLPRDLDILLQKNGLVV